MNLYEAVFSEGSAGRASLERKYKALKTKRNTAKADFLAEPTADKGRAWAAATRATSSIADRLQDKLRRRLLGRKGLS